MKQPNINEGLPVKKKTVLTAAFISLFLAAVAGTQFVNLGWANPIHNSWIYEGDVSPDSSTKPPTVSILSPERNNVYATDNISLSLKVSIGDSSTASSRVLREIYCKTDWLPNKFSVYNYSWNSLYPSTSQTEFSETINLTGIPDGNHTMTVYAVESGRYITHRGPEGSGLNPISYAYYYVNFNITGCSLVRFTVDTTPPKVTVFSLENKTDYPSDLPLNFTVNEPVSKITYTLDGQENVSVTGNTTLTGLSNGKHAVTVYATDEAGNIGASETIVFSVTVLEPFPTELVTVAGASVGFVSVGLVVYSVKIRRRMKKL